MIVSRFNIEQAAQNAARAGLCPHAACPWPAYTEAAQLFHEVYAQALRVHQQAEVAP